MINRSTGLKIISWNLRSFSSRVDDLYSLISEHFPHVLCLSEIRLDASDVITIRGYRSFSSPRDKRRGGSAILVRCDVAACEEPCKQIKISCKNNGIDLSTIRCSLAKSHSLVVASLYSPPRSSGNYTEYGFWEEFFAAFSGLGPVIISGDFNGHAGLWSGSLSKTNEERKRIESTSMSEGFTCVSDGTPTWCSSDASCWSILDLFFCVTP